MTMLPGASGSTTPPSMGPHPPHPLAGAEAALLYSAMMINNSAYCMNGTILAAYPSVQGGLGSAQKVMCASSPIVET